jgi:hypothetical protein
MSVEPQSDALDLSQHDRSDRLRHLGRDLAVPRRRRVLGPLQKSIERAALRHRNVDRRVWLARLGIDAFGRCLLCFRRLIVGHGPERSGLCTRLRIGRVALGLDLSESRAKLDRAQIHLQALHAELPRIKDRNPIAIRFTEIDPDSGWCEAYGRWNHIKEPSLSVIAGDYVHNLRSALDYLVTALVEASDTRLRTSHEFPIFTDATEYAKKVGTAEKARRGGPLHGVVHGLVLIEDVQPYHDQPDPERDSLARINRLSNTDKHRQTLVLSERMERPQLVFKFAGAQPVESWATPTWGLAVDEETKIAAFRFAKPYPSKMGVEPGKLDPLLGAPAFPPKYPLGVLLGMDRLDEIWNDAAKIVERAEAL